MPITWTEDKTLRLLRLYNRHECLRNPFHPNFKDKLCRYKAYKEILDSMNVTGLTICDCIKRITYLKTQYCYELSKISAAISSEKCYVPRASWFRIMHEIFFPFIQTSPYLDDSKKVPNEGNNVYDKYYSSNNINDNLYLNSVGCNRTAKSSYGRSYANYQCYNFRKEENPMCFKKSRGENIIQKDGVEKKISIVTKITSVSSIGNLIGVGCNTSNYFITQEAQTDISYFINKSEQSCRQTHRNTITENQAAINKQAKKDTKDLKCTNNTAIDVSRERKRHRDEFDMFGKSVAFQLRSVNFETAVELEKRIQNLITKERLVKMHRPINLECSCSCSDCKIMHKETTCNCGLPVIVINADQSCESRCK